MRRLEKLIVLLLIVCLLVSNSVDAFAAPPNKSTTPSAPTLSYSPMTPTNSNVSVVINYPSSATTKQYMLGTNGVWTTYTGPITLTENAYVVARYISNKGIWSSLGGVTVSNIDKIAPLNPTFSADSNTLTNQNVAVTIDYSVDSSDQQFKIGDSGSWTSYRVPIILSSNNIIYARASDAAGNVTETVSYTVNNIDKIAPMDPVFNLSNTNVTREDIVVTIGFSEDSVVKQYKMDDSLLWIDYSEPFIFSRNGSIFAKSQDIAGNWSNEAVILISNIDHDLTSPQISISDMKPTNQDITVTIDFNIDSFVQQYRLGSAGIWTDYMGPFTVDTNITIYAKASSEGENESIEVSYEITNIDKMPPERPSITASTVNLTNQEVIVSIDYSSDSIFKQFKVGATDIWLDYNAPITLTTNSIVYGRGIDVAGNISSEVQYEVKNIDTEAPSNPVLMPSMTGLTNQPILLTINYSADSYSKLYKVGSSGVWLEYSSPITISSNDTIYAKASDAAGNWSWEVNYIINNIDITGPLAPVFYPSVTLPTSQPVNITIEYGQDSVVKQYKVGINGNWINYMVPVVVISNNTVYAKSADLLGNWSSEESYTVSNITKKIVMGYTVKYYSTDMSSYNSMVANVNILSDIATATYSIDGLGNLTGTVPVDQINYANDNGIRANLMVSNHFDPNIAKQLLQSPENRLNLKNQIIYYLKTYNYKGVDIDIENIPAICRNDFTAFMSEIYSALKPLGYQVSVAVPAKTNDSSLATWNYAFDYKSLAQYSDFLMIMAYDEHYPGGTPGAVASIDWVKNVVSYTLTVVPKEKIVLGLAAYGYDWSSGATKAYSINGCLNLAKQYGSTIYFDAASQSKYFTYEASGVSHTVWFEDGETIALKLDLVNSNDLKGIGIWRLGLENAGFWDTIKGKIY